MDSGGSGGSRVPTAQENQRTIDKMNLPADEYNSKYRDRMRTMLTGAPTEDSPLQNGPTFLG